MTQEDTRVIQLLKKHLEQIPALKEEEALSDSPAFIEWETNISTVIRRVFGKESDELERFSEISFEPRAWVVSTGYPTADDLAREKKYYQDALENAGAQLRSIITIIETMGLE